MQKIIRIISKEEIEMVNPTLSVRCGALNKVSSGTYIRTEDGERQYHIVLNDGCNKYKSREFLAKIGKLAKEIWNANSIYYFGVKIA